MRTRAFRREVRNKAIARKKKLCASWGIKWYKFDGQYSKGKIHCSCGICKYSRKYKLTTVRDRREIEKALSELKELEN